MNQTDPLTLALTGQMPFILIAAAILALPVSFILLWLYRRAVIKSMLRSSAEGMQLKPGSTDLNKQATRLKVKIVEARQAAPCASTCADFLSKLQFYCWKNALIYAKAGTAFTSVMTAAVLLSGTSDFFLIRTILVFWVYAWPIVLTLNLLAATARKQLVFTSGGYFAVFIVLIVLAQLTGNDSSSSQIIQLWAITNLPPTVLILAFLARPVRAVGPMVLSFMIIALTGSVIAMLVVGSSDEAMRIISAAAFDLGLQASGTFMLILIMGFMLFAIIGWLVVRLIRKGYQSGKLTDQSMTVDAMWILFAVVQSTGLVFEGAGWILSGVFAFIAYKIVIKHGFKVLSLKTEAQNTRLLLLRVFSLGKRSEQLFNAITKHWRSVGSVQLISGPDLATTTVEPHEFIDFLSGKLSRQFIASQQQLDQRLSGLDTPQDFDGRYRVVSPLADHSTDQPAFHAQLPAPVS